jgi:hypothetical protein
MRRIRTLTAQQIEAASVDFAELSASLARFYPSKSEEKRTQLASLVAAAAMLESESLLTHAVDTIAILVQAEAHVAPLGPDAD